MRYEAKEDIIRRPTSCIALHSGMGVPGYTKLVQHEVAVMDRKQINCLLHSNRLLIFRATATACCRA